MIRRSLSVASVLAVAALMAGCSILKTPPPVQTYRFNATPAFAAPTTINCQPVKLGLRRIQFNEVSQSSRILAVTGTEAAYIGGGRWVSEASTLFQSALEDGFANGAPCLQLTQGSFGRDTLVLGIDVRRFETIYDAPGGTPRVRMEVAVKLMRALDRNVVADTRFDVIEPVEENRISSIVSAYDRANADVVRQIVQWTSSEVGKVGAN